ncbi:hypothetical protein DPMN_076195 [Dreissena polymorpha]|uniref:Uncharacterized protein n=1 Tax=Dreissena polymorpha TaxID=45954 RepID=A0A9D3YIA1_DREPO|nr:hypothetical protein DPMN_076195 [Dreissena polymorpha]
MAIHVAAYSPKTTLELARELVSYMIKNHDWNSLNDKDLKGQTSLHIACRHTTTDVLWEFRQVKLNERDPDGLTHLHVAVRPKQPDILETVLDMFERNKRDLSINEQTISNGKTVLHLDAQDGHSTSIPRLIKLGADIAVRDVNDDTVLHKLIKLSVFDVTNNSKYIESFTIILLNIVRWWCLKSGTAIPENEHDSDYIVIQRTAFRFIIYDVHNIDGLSVLKQAFQCGATKIVGELLMVEQVTFFETDGYTFDVSYLTSRTNEVEEVKSHSVSQVSPTDQ